MFETVAKAALRALWAMRTPLDLLGSSLDVSARLWYHAHGGIGAGADSFYEYLLKAHLLFGARSAAWSVAPAPCLLQSLHHQYILAHFAHILQSHRLRQMIRAEPAFHDFGIACHCPHSSRLNCSMDD